MTEEDIRSLWARDKAAYLSWGTFVRDQILDRLSVVVASQNVDFDGFLLVRPEPRLKDENSLIDKALYRTKNYANPYDDITDKVGLRFVVLLTKHIPFVEQALKATECKMWWYARKDVDFRNRRTKAPNEFGYESVHYIVIAKNELNGPDQQRIPKGFSCEVQIRSVLQHACSELMHDTVYKFKTKPDADTMRTVARTSALLETTDRLFLEVAKQMKKATKSETDLLEYLEKLYLEVIGRKPDRQGSSQIILEAIIPLLRDDWKERLESLFANKSFLANIVRQRSSTNGLNRQPIILVLYLLATELPIHLKTVWPLVDGDLRKVYEDLGISFDNQ